MRGDDIQGDIVRIVDLQSTVIDAYKNLMIHCLALLYCVIDEEVPKHVAARKGWRLERKFHELTSAYEVDTRPGVDRVTKSDLRKMLKNLGLDPPGER